MTSEKRHCLLMTTDVLSLCGVNWNSALWMTPSVATSSVCLCWRWRRTFWT